MIKFVVNGSNGRKLVGLALSAENIKRLQAENPILFPAEEVGFEGVDILIMAGETEEAIKQDLQKHFTIGKEVDNGENPMPLR